MSILLRRQKIIQRQREQVKEGESHPHHFKHHDQRPLVYESPSQRMASEAKEANAVHEAELAEFEAWKAQRGQLVPEQPPIE